jgi:hypothetical protein
MPDQSQLWFIPRLALAALAARVARRVLPLFRLGWPEAPELHIQALRRAVEAVEAAALGVGFGYLGEAGRDARAAFEAAPELAAAEVAQCVARAVIVLMPTVTPSIQADFGMIFAGKAAEQIVPGCRPLLNASVARDHALLVEWGTRQTWGDETPVPPDVFGLMWPEGPPPGWPVLLDPAWRTASVLRVAQSLFDSQRYDELPVLGDALEEAGCTDEILLAATHWSEPRVLGFWVIDTVLSSA